MITQKIEILSAYDAENLRNRLLQFPALIREQKTRTATTRQAFKEAEQVKAEAEAELTLAVAAEINPNTGKPAFSNAEARAAELARRKKDDPAYLEACRRAREAEMAANEAQFDDLEKLWDEFKAYRYVADLTARELALMAAGADEDQEEAAKEPF